VNTLQPDVLKNLTPTGRLRATINLVARSPFEPEQVEDVIQPLHRRRAPVKRTFRRNRYVRT